MDGSTGTAGADDDANDKSGDCGTNRRWILSSVTPSFVVELTTLLMLLVVSSTMMRVVFFFCLDVGVDAGDNDALQFDAAEG